MSSFHVLILHLNFVGVVAINVTSIHVHDSTLICLLTMLHQRFQKKIHVASCYYARYCILSCNSCCIVIFVF
jgi:hypothetical protein